MVKLGLSIEEEQKPEASVSEPAPSKVDCSSQTMEEVD